MNATRAILALQLRLANFGRDERGNFILLMSVSIFALIVFIGMAIDYFTALSDRARLDQSADAAALAAVNAAKAFYKTNSGTLPTAALAAEAEAAGKRQGAAVFQANLGSAQLAGPVAPSISVNYDETLGQFSAKVVWQGSLAVHFGPLVGIPTLGLSGTSAAVSSLPKHLDFYILTDVSGSMGVPTSVADQNYLIKTNPDNAIEAAQYPSGCQFACHFSGYSGYSYAEQAGLTLKLDSVAYAIQNLIDTAMLDESSANGIAGQYRVGVYPFIDNVIEKTPLTATLQNVLALVTPWRNGPLGALLDAGESNGGMGSGGTHFENLARFFSFDSVLKPGTGVSADSTLPFVVLVTDGVDNNQTYPWTGSQPQLPDTTSASSFCTLAKTAGYTVAVLLIPYVPIVDPDPNFSNDEDGVVNYLLDPTSNPLPSSPPAASVPDVPPGDNVSVNMQKCASAGYFFSAGTTDEVNAAMQTIFHQANQQARLTQ